MQSLEKAKEQDVAEVCFDIAEICFAEAEICFAVYTEGIRGSERLSTATKALNCWQTCNTFPWLYSQIYGGCFNRNGENYSPRRFLNVI
jgi:hypothetical protein